MKRLKRFAALTAVILWGIMIIATLILAFIDNEACHKVAIIIMPQSMTAVNAANRFNRFMNKTSNVRYLIIYITLACRSSYL